MWKLQSEAVTTIAAQQIQWPQTLSAIGSVAAVQGVIVSADLSGTIDRVAFESGRAVRQGDLLVQLDTRQERAQLEAAEAERDLARTNFDRMEGLLKDNVISRAEFDRATADEKATSARAGEIRAERRVTITVPPASETGDRVMLRGQGQGSAAGQPTGDLVITFQVQPDRFFRREGLDIIADVPINLAQAALGTRLRVRTLDGKKVLLRIPPGTQSGRKFRIKGQGIEKNGRRGDQLVGVQVTIPDELTQEQQELMKRFADSAGLKY
jgi:multidrug efflux pump subunit AcrA (membrane-fusion protein)